MVKIECDNPVTSLVDRCSSQLCVDAKYWEIVVCELIRMDMLTKVDLLVTTRTLGHGENSAADCWSPTGARQNRPGLNVVWLSLTPSELIPTIVSFK